MAFSSTDGAKFEQMHILPGGGAPGIVIGDPMQNANSQCGTSLFDKYMLEHDPFPYDPCYPVSHVNTLWAGRKLLLLPEAGGPWVGATILDMKQSNCGPYQGSTFWSCRVQLDEEAQGLGAELETELDRRQRSLRQRSLRLHRIDLSGGGTFERPGAAHPRTERDRISFKWVDPPSPPQSDDAVWWPAPGQRAKLVGLSRRAELNGTTGLLGAYNEARERWPFHPEGGGAPTAVKPTHLEQIDHAYPFPLSGAGTAAEPWAVPAWPVEAQFSAAELEAMRTAATARMPPPGRWWRGGEEARHCEAVKVMIEQVHALLVTGSAQAKIMARCRNEVEEMLLSMPLRMLLNEFWQAVTAVAKTDRLAAVALCVAHAAVLPQRLQCVEALLATRQPDSNLADEIGAFHAGAEGNVAAMVLHKVACDALNLLGELHEDSGDVERPEAILSYRRCLSHCLAYSPGETQLNRSLNNLGLALKRGGHLGEALKMYEAATKNHGENREILLEEIMEWKGTAVEPWD